MRRIRVLQCSIANTKSGVTQYIINNWEKINHNKFQFDFLTFSAKLDMQSQLECNGGKVFFVKNKAEENLILFETEIREILKNKYDVIHIHTSYWKSLNIERLAHEAGIPKIIIHAHNSAIFDDDDREKKREQHERIKSMIDERIATDFWACSKVAADFLYGNRISKEKIRIMSNAIDVDKYKYNISSRNEIRNKFGWKDKFVVGHVGRFSYQKNHEFLVELLKEVRYNIPNLQIVLIGKGKLEEKIKLQVEESGLSDIVYFAGPVDNTECWYSAMDLFLLPSRFEGMPIVLVETQTNGLLSVISDTITSEARITDLVYQVELDIYKWVNKILELYHENNKCDRENMFNSINNSEFDIDIQITELENEYMSCQNGG